MTTEQNPRLEFLSEDPYSLRAISQTWIKNKIIEVGSEEAAWDHVLQSLYERYSENIREGSEVILYEPASETEPYIIALPLDERTSKQRRAEVVKANQQVVIDNREMTLREQFEEIIFEQERYLSPKDLERDAKGIYVNKKVEALWDGFNLYHRLTEARKRKLNLKTSRYLGWYVIAKIAANGSFIFTKVPYRHQTKSLAMVEANRLVEEFDEPFAVLRCVDILG